MRLYPLYSSSEGNCTYIGDCQSGILVDIGVSCKKVCEALLKIGSSPESVKAVFITHDHSDHLKGLKVFTKKYHPKIFALPEVIRFLKQNEMVNEKCECVEIRAAGNSDEAELISFRQGQFYITAFETSHDSLASCGYKICDSDGKSVSICTDLGFVSSVVHGCIKGSDAVLIEANYNENMLRNGSYPRNLKARISSNQGHLSNSDCADEILNLLQDGTKHFVIGHLSRENNSPDAALSEVVCTLEGYRRGIDYTLAVATPHFSGLSVII